MNKNIKSQIFNCGYGKGYTILEIVNAFKSIINKNIIINYKRKRKGEIPISYSDNKKIKKLLKWRPKFDNLKLMVKSSLVWEKNLKKKNFRK